MILPTPYAVAAPLALRSLAPLAPAVRGRTQEIAVDLGATYGDPFDPQEVSVDATIEGPEGKIERPGFFTRPFARAADGAETPAGPGVWRIRWTPLAAGPHRVAVRVRDRTGEVTRTLDVPVGDGPAPTFVRVSPRDGRYFETADGKPFFPVGANVGWGKDGAEMEGWIAKFGADGANWVRVWLSPAWTTLGLEQPGKPDEGKGVGRFDLGAAWRLDRVLEAANRAGVRVQVCLESYNVLRDQDAYNYWEKTPHNAANGGPLRIWSDYWTSSAMDLAVRKKLRYLSARYGADPALFAWEFWNEVDLTRDFDPVRAQAWHRKTAGVLRSLDAYAHPITTSAAATPGVRALDQLPEIEFLQSHHYGADDPAGVVAAYQARKGSSGKPHFFGEIGADAAGPRAEDDPEGLQNHDPAWAAVASGSAGTAMPWWWDSYLAPRGLSQLFRPLADFVAGVDFPAEGFRPVAPVFGYQHAPPTPRRVDATVPLGPRSWEPGPIHRPRTVTLSRAGKFGGQVPVAGLLHGGRNHPELLNPVRFRVDLPRATRFTVDVGDVSGYGGAGLAIELDGARILTRRFDDPDGDSDTKTITKYAGSYSVTIPPGEHVVRVSNPGADWVSVAYRFEGLVIRRDPPVQGWATVGARTALAWVRPQGRTWGRVIALRKPPPPAPPVWMALRGLPAGRWRAEVWDTWTGARVSERDLYVRNDGLARVAIPTMPKDWGVRLRLEEGPKR